MVVRSNALYSLSPGVSMFVAGIGAATAFFAATIAIVQVDLKRVLAYSTISQLGYMFMAVGVGAYTAGMFHLTTQAFFKALLFLGAGSVMHALHDVIDLRRMGGLKDKMKLTWLTFWAGGLAKAGFPFTSGFFSKDEILARAFAVSPVLWVVGIVTAVLTAFYTFRAIFLAFHGQPRDRRLYDHAHESRLPITFALVVLALLALFGGLLGLPSDLLQEWGLNVPHALEKWLEPIYATAEPAVTVGGELHLSLGTELGLLSASTIVAVLGIVLAYLFYVVRPSWPQNLARQARPLFELLVNKYYVDEFYDLIFVRPGLYLARAMSAGVDTLLIDTFLVDGLARSIGWLGQEVSRLQSGYLRHYALATFIGVLIMIIYFFLR
jgi:NADH-quinone oxidoreductase subunit L